MDITNFADHVNNKRAGIDVMNVLINDPNTGEPWLKLDTLKVSTVSVSGEQKDVTGGIGNPKLLTHNYNKEVTLEIEDALYSRSSFEYLSGSSEKLTGSDVVYTRNEKLTVTGGAVTLTGANTLDPRLYIVTPGFYADPSTITATSVSIYTDETFLTPAEDEAEVEVFYQAVGGADAVSLTIKGEDAPQNVEIIGHTRFKDQQTGEYKLIEIRFPNFALDPNFEITLDGGAEASTFNFSGQALQDKNGKMFIWTETGINFDSDIAIATK